jgi:glutamyl-tRNA reductase
MEGSLMKLQMVGCSHHNSSLALRERLAFSPIQAGEALDRWRLRYPAAEAVLLSTCNRVEIYTAWDAGTGGPDHQQVAQFLAEFHGIDLGAIFDDLFQQSGEAAVRHLFTVAASLDSMVLGEPQILAQVKQAYQLAQQHESAGPLTHEMFQAALRVAKRVAGETSIYRRRVSVASVAVGEFARDIFDRFDDKQVLVIGAGEMGEEALRYLRDEGARQLTIINRSPERAAAMAEQFAGRAAAWELLDELLVAADLVVSTTGATEPILSLARFRRIEPQRYQRPLLILDLAVPRDFEPAIGDCLGVYLYSIDDLEVVCQINRRKRDDELPAAIAIIEDETQRFMDDLHHRATGPIVERLRANWQTMRDQELGRLFNKLPDLSESEREEIRRSFERYVNKMLHPPLEQLRDDSRRGHPHGLLEALKRLFRLRE